MDLKFSRHEIPQNNDQIAFLQCPYGKEAKLELTFYRKQKMFFKLSMKINFDHLAFEAKDTEKTIAMLRKEEAPITGETFARANIGIVALKPDSNKPMHCQT